MPIPILIAILLLAVGCGIAIWFIISQSKIVKRTETLSFRWSYIALPVAIFLLSVVLAVYFYRYLSAEVAYHFKPDGSPDRWLSRQTIAVWMLAPQLIFALLAVALAWIMTKLGNLFQRMGNIQIKQEGLISVMGNMIALPQIILCFVMLNSFSYNLYQMHIVPMRAFAWGIIGIGGIALTAFFVQFIRRALRARRSN